MEHHCNQSKRTWKMDWWIAQLHFLSYIVLLGATTLHTYIEVIHVWMFPSISSWVIAGAFWVYVITL